MNWKTLLLSHLAIVILLGTFIWPAAHSCIWAWLDRAVFQLLNGSLKGAPLWQLFWAFANHKKADLVEDAIFLIFFGLAIKTTPPQQRIRKIAECVFCTLWAAAVIGCVTRVFFRWTLTVYRPSPSLVLTPCIYLSELFPWLIIKDRTTASFPGDHALTLLLFGALYTFYAGRRLGVYAISYCFLRLLPRLFVGAHWFSDIAVGSVSFALFFLSWPLCTPFHTWVINKIEAIIRYFTRQLSGDKMIDHDSQEKAL